MHPDVQPSRENRPADALMAELYRELRALAAAQMQRERPGHTLQPTALVNEVYLRLADQTRAHWKDRNHFFAVAAGVIRRVLVDHARARHALKRAAPGERVTIDADLDAVAGGRGVDLAALDEALTRLAALNERQARVVELRFFAGLSVEETATLLGVSEGTVKGDWRVARAWLEANLDDRP